MSHSIPIQSLPGTPLADRTVGELVAERPGRSRIFQRFEIDFCCQGGRTLHEACTRKGVNVDTLIEQLEAELAAPAPSGFNPAELAPAQLADYIVARHHAFLWRELPRLHAMARRVAQVHGGHTPSLIEVEQVFDGLQEELAAHMMKEEQVLFPAIRSISGGDGVPGQFDGPIACMVDEHETAGQALARLRELTNGFQPPPDACNTYRALFAGLHELEEDLHQHIHLENSVLFPAAIRLLEGVA
ncbi:MAG: iron-sulfur cluster repair di-iron protein [Verrucomicrobiae bacterium]|nr:iron-sulfur cluster repair di-iron protein [Verrucomicrobiae bacterium]